MVGADSTVGLWRWHHGRLEKSEESLQPDARILAADSWLVTAGRVRALELHRERFAAACAVQFADDASHDHGRPLPEKRLAPAELRSFWAAILKVIPPDGNWFPKVEWRQQPGTKSTFGEFVFSLRTAPARSRSVVVRSHRGSDPRTLPRVKGPDLVALGHARAEAQVYGADEAIILAPEGFVVEGAYSALVWWQGNELCVPAAQLARIDSITNKTLVTLAQALGVSVQEELARPADLVGREVWALSALHGIRIVTSWVDGPALAEQPGRLATWRASLDRLAHPIAALTP